MSDIRHVAKEKGTKNSYIIGFILSLIFTINAYYMVVSKSISGNTLLTTILVFAVIQMVIQIFFFLHLGRGPKPLYNVVFFAGTAGIIVVVVIGSIFIMNNLHYNMSPNVVTTKLAQDEGISEVNGTATGACNEIRENHRITITNGVASPSHTDTKLCDTLSFISGDGEAYIIDFGSGSQPTGYTGQDVTIQKNYPKTINLNKPGIFNFHDSKNRVTGSFTVGDK